MSVLIWLAALLFVPFGVVLACGIGWRLPSLGFAIAVALALFASQHVPRECSIYADFCIPLVDRLVFGIPAAAALLIGGCALLGPWNRARNQWRERVVALPVARVCSRELLR